MIHQLMKKILYIFTIIPFIIFAQSRITNSKKPPLIESITSYSANGQFYQVLFIYDQSNRVIEITHKVLEITTVAKKQTIQIKEEVKQVFEYTGNSIVPYVRKTGHSNFNKTTNKWHTDFFEVQYFLFESGFRVGDSTLLIKDQKRIIGKLKQTDEGISHEIDLRPPFNPKKYENPNSYENYFYLKSPSNIGEEFSNHNTGYKWGERTYYTFSTFDSMVNPLKQLNIASILVNERISFPYNSGKNKSDKTNLSFFRGGQYGERGFNWYFFNQNNPVTYTIDNGQTDHYKGIIHLQYSYNQFKQPIFVKANVRVVMNGAEDYLLEKYQKRFTFRYKK